METIPAGCLTAEVVSAAVKATWELFFTWRVSHLLKIVRKPFYIGVWLEQYPIEIGPPFSGLSLRLVGFFSKWWLRNYQTEDHSSVAFKVAEAMIKTPDTIMSKERSDCQGGNDDSYRARARGIRAAGFIVVCAGQLSAPEAFAVATSVHNLCYIGACRVHRDAQVEDNLNRQRFLERK